MNNIEHIIYCVGCSSQYYNTASLCCLVADALQTFSADPDLAFEMLQINDRVRTRKLKVVAL